MDDGAPAWYGKLSSLGDFAHRRMSPRLLELCDTWLSRAIADSRERLGAGWLEVYLRAPLWRFAWAPGVVDERWWFGVLMPSCDNVGRYFPLIVAARGDIPPGDAIALDHLERWYESAAQAVLQTLHGHASSDDFDRALHDEPRWPSAAAPGLRVSGASDRHRVLLERLKGRSIWWRGAEAPGALLVVRGLPEGADFLELLGEGVETLLTDVLASEPREGR